MSCNGGERPGKKEPPGARSQAAGRTSLAVSGGSRGSSVTGMDPVALPTGGQSSAFCCRLLATKCPAWDTCCPGASWPPPPCHVLLTVTLAKGHHLGASPRGTSQSLAKDRASVGSGSGNRCGSCDGELRWAMTAREGGQALGHLQRDGMKPPRNPQGREKRRRSCGTWNPSSDHLQR